MTLNEVRAACNVCTQCPLSVTRNSLVFGVGPEKTPVMFVGEGPGQREDERPRTATHCKPSRTPASAGCASRPR